MIDIWSRTNDQVSKAMMAGLSKETVTNRDGEDEEQDSFNSVYMYADSGATGFTRADPAVGRYAGSDGQAGWLNYRDADHGELPRGAERTAVLHFYPRRA